MEPTHTRTHTHEKRQRERERRARDEQSVFVWRGGERERVCVQEKEGISFEIDKGREVSGEIGLKQNITSDVCVCSQTCKRESKSWDERACKCVCVCVICGQ